MSKCRLRNRAIKTTRARVASSCSQPVVPCRLVFTCPIPDVLFFFCPWGEVSSSDADDSGLSLARTNSNNNGGLALVQRPGPRVCEKWLKDRKGRLLSADDIQHYHRIVVALYETIRIMTEIDKVIEAHGGWPRAFLGRNEESSTQG